MAVLGQPSLPLLTQPPLPSNLGLRQEGQGLGKQQPLSRILGCGEEAPHSPRLRKRRLSLPQGSLALTLED